MINIVIWFAAFLCPNPNHTSENHGSCTLLHMTSSANTEDTGGETGGIPKPPFPPPPPTPPGN